MARPHKGSGMNSRNLRTIAVNAAILKDLQLLIGHAQRDINYGVNGTYGNGENWNKKGEVDKAQSALNRLSEWFT